MPKGDGASVAAGPRFLKCYDAYTLEARNKVVAAGPRFLKCYDARIAVAMVFALQLDRDF